MKSTVHFTLFVSSLSFFILAGWVAQAEEEVQNLVANPDFVDMQQKWRLVTSSGAANWEVEEKDGVGDDEECVFIEVTALPDPWWHIYLTQSDIPLEKGKKYTYCVWARTEEGGNKDITLKVQKGTDPWTAYISKPFAIDGEWKEYWVTWNQFEAQANSQIIVFVGSAQRIGKDKLWLDHFRVYEGDYKEDELSPKAVKSKGKLVNVWGSIKSPPKHQI